MNTAVLIDQRNTLRSIKFFSAGIYGLVGRHQFSLAAFAPCEKRIAVFNTCSTHCLTCLKITSLHRRIKQNADKLLGEHKMLQKPEVSLWPRNMKSGEKTLIPPLSHYPTTLLTVQHSTTRLAIDVQLITLTLLSWSILVPS